MQPVATQPVTFRVEDLVRHFNIFFDQVVDVLDSVPPHYARDVEAGVHTFGQRGGIEHQQGVGDDLGVVFDRRRCSRVPPEATERGDGAPPRNTVCFRAPWHRAGVPGEEGGELVSIPGPSGRRQGIE